jgi:cobyrinic acid a,c-diamide synthase
MDDNKLNALLDEMEKKRKEAESIAQMKAMDFVRTNDAQDRAFSKQYLHDADIWSEAAAMVRKHRAG